MLEVQSKQELGHDDIYPHGNVHQSLGHSDGSINLYAPSDWHNEQQKTFCEK